MEYSFYEAIIFPFPCVKYDTIIFTQDWIQFLGKRNNNSFHQAGYKKSNQQSSSPNIWLLNNIDKFEIKTRPECPLVAKERTMWLNWFYVSTVNLDTSHIVYYPHGISKCTFIISCLLYILRSLHVALSGLCRIAVGNVEFSRIITYETSDKYAGVFMKSVCLFYQLINQYMTLDPPSLLVWKIPCFWHDS